MGMREGRASSYSLYKLGTGMASPFATPNSLVATKKMLWAEASLRLGGCHHLRLPKAEVG